MRQKSFERRISNFHFPRPRLLSKSIIIIIKSRYSRKNISHASPINQTGVWTCIYFPYASSPSFSHRNPRKNSFCEASKARNFIYASSPSLTPQSAHHPTSHRSPLSPLPQSAHHPAAVRSAPCLIPRSIHHSIRSPQPIHPPILSHRTVTRF